MEIKGIRVLLIVALALELLALLTAMGITAMQSSAKTIMTADMDIINILSVPIGWLSRILLMLTVYGIGLVICGGKNLQFTKVKAVILVVVACMFQIILQYTSFLSHLVAMQGVNALASYTMVESLISYIANPLHTIAFALFLVACGGYYGLKDTAKEVQSY